MSTANAAKRVQAGTRMLGVYDILDSSVAIQWVGEPLGYSDCDEQTVRSAIYRYGCRAAATPGCTMAMGIFNRDFSREHKIENPCF